MRLSYHSPSLQSLWSWNMAECYTQFCSALPLVLMGRQDLVACLDCALFATSSRLLSLSVLFSYCTMRMIATTWKG